MKIIKLAEYGICPGKDITLSINKIFENNPRDTAFEFEDGDYYLSPKTEMHYPYTLSNTDASEYKVLGLWLRNMKNCEIRGNGARFWFAGQMQPITLDQCENIRVHGLTIDWKKPLAAEGIVVSSEENWIRMYIDPTVFPHRMRNGWLEFDTGAGEWYPLVHESALQYDAANLCIRANSGDKFKPVRIEDEGEDIYKFYTLRATDVNTVKGNIFVLRHNSRKHAGIFMERSSNITVEGVTIHSCGGLGCLSQFCENVQFENVNFVPNTRLGRRVTSGRDDGMHITSNKGRVVITKCTFLGLMDDPINVHGCSVDVEALLDPCRLRCSFQHIQARGFSCWSQAGDVLAIVDRQTAQPLCRLETAEYRLENIRDFVVTFREKIPDAIQEMLRKGTALALENLTNTPEFICRDNRFGSCRARGLLVSTPKRTLIENNYFETSGSAILIPGDCNYWYESGACHDLTIRYNVFTNRCNTSNYQFCEGVISICPVVPEPDADRPFHDHIRIENNIFDIGKSRCLYAFSCGDLTVRENRIYLNHGEYNGDTSGKIMLEFCSGVQIRGNTVVGNKEEDLICQRNSRQVSVSV